MDAEIHSKIVNILDQILSDGQLIYSRVRMLDKQTDPIMKGSEILAKLEKVKKIIEEVCELELVGAKRKMCFPFH